MEQEEPQEGFGEVVWQRGCQIAWAMLYFTFAKFVLLQKYLEEHVRYGGPIIFCAVFSLICSMLCRWTGGQLRGRDASVVTRLFASLDECCHWLCKRSGTVWNPPADWNQLPTSQVSLLRPLSWFMVNSERRMKRRLDGQPPGHAVVLFANDTSLPFLHQDPTLFFVPDWQPADEPTIVQVIRLGTMRQDGARKWASKDTVLKFQLNQMLLVAFGYAIGFAWEETFETVITQLIDGGEEGEEGEEIASGLSTQGKIVLKYGIALALTLILGFVYALPSPRAAAEQSADAPEEASADATPEDQSPAAAGHEYEEVANSSAPDALASPLVIN